MQGIKMLLPFLIKSPEFSQEELNNLVEQLSHSNAAEQEKEESKIGISKNSINPNEADWKTLVEIGFESKTANTIINFREKGGKINSLENIERIYGITDQEIDNALPFLYFPKTNREGSNKIVALKEQPKNIKQINLNTATEEELIQLKGIGPVFSKRIVRFRNSLGGFFTIEQLKEVYGLPLETYESLTLQVFVNKESVEVIKLNSASEYDLSKHPYIDKQLAKSIIDLRKREERNINLEDLKQLPLINEEIYRKIAPYLDVN